MMVIGAMSLLFAVCASVAVAAYANLGYNARQAESNRIRVLSESIHRNIKFALQQDQGAPTSMTSQLVMSLFRAVEAGDEPEDVLLSIDINNIEFVPPQNLHIKSITLSWGVDDVRITPAAPYIPGIDFGGTPGFVNIPAVARRPQTADVNATLSVTVEIEAVRFLGVRSRPITTVSTYEYRDGFLTQETSVAPPYDPLDENANTVYEMRFGSGLGNFGTWSLISYETIDPID